MTDRTRNALGRWGPPIITAIVALSGGAWALQGRLTRVETKQADFEKTVDQRLTDLQKDVKEILRRH